MCVNVSQFYFVCSDRTDVESTHSSNISAHRDKMHAIIPPDALYGSVEKRPKFAYVDAADFNDSKVSSSRCKILLVLVAVFWLRKHV